MNTLLPTLEVIGGDIMIIKCPYCGSNDYECFDRVGDGTDTPRDLCSCLECDGIFDIVYKFSHIEKRD